MGLKIRLARAGAKKRPYYHIVIADSRSPRDGRFIERVGSYNPMLPAEHEDRVRLRPERLAHWIGNGAVATEMHEQLKQPYVASDTRERDGDHVRELDERIGRSVDLVG